MTAKVPTRVSYFYNNLILKKLFTRQKRHILIFYIFSDRLSFSLFGNNISRIQESQPTVLNSWGKSLQFCYYGIRQHRYLRGRCYDRSTSHCYPKHISNSTFKVSLKKRKYSVHSVICIKKKTHLLFLILSVT